MAYTTIDNPELYFQTKLYTGTGSTHAITLDGSENMQPDWVWSKARESLSIITGSHFLFDSVRGGGAEKEIRSNNSGAEGSSANQVYGYVSSFDSDGFTTTAGSSNNDYFNKSSVKYVAWNWKAGGSASSNGDGDITSSVSVNTTAGFSIVSYTGNGSATQTIGHGLGAVPKWMIFKRRNSSSDWIVYHNKTGATKYLSLNLTGAASAYEPYFANTEPTSSVFTVDTAGDINGSSDTFIAYLFSEIKGYSKFGSYTGNQNTDGPFVYTGFRPAWVMVKRTDSTSDWLICDSKRPGFNPIDDKLFPNTSQAEDPYESFDFVSNGFKITSAGTGHNASGANMIYMAFAESPFVNSNGVANNAR